MANDTAGRAATFHAENNAVCFVMVRSIKTVAKLCKKQGIEHEKWLSTVKLTVEPALL